MQKVLDALSSSSNALLESPTGTGKTLALLSSSVAYLAHLKSRLPPTATPTTTTQSPKPNKKKKSTAP
jgi:Rad3-related DNA helicase